jgi:ParB family chromosome partitioning protein
VKSFGSLLRTLEREYFCHRSQEALCADSRRCGDAQNRDRWGQHAAPWDENDMSQVVSVNPFRCKVWDLHDRLDHLIVEDTCRDEISSFARHGQLIAALGRPLRNHADYDIELICGARRLFVARHLNVQLLVDLRDLTDQDAIIAMDMENRQRQDISPYERGLSFARCLRSGYFKSQEHLAKALKISQSQVSRLLTLARLPSVVVNAFTSPLDIREGWGPDLVGALQDIKKRDATIVRARSLASATPRLPAVDVYQHLISASVKGRKLRTRSRDEVVTDIDGTALFRVRPQEKAIAVLLPRDGTSQETLSAICDAIRDVLQRRNRGASSLQRTSTEVTLDRPGLSVSA